MFNLKPGFTLLEILVVIAIIGLLAAVVFLSLAYAQAKARNSVQNQTIYEYRQAFLLLGYYPGASSGNCIGTHPSGLCGYNSQTPQNAGINSALNAFLPGPPALPPVTYTSGSTMVFRGPIYECANPGAPCSEGKLIWQLEYENQDCGPGQELASFGGTTRCELVF